MNRVRPQLTSLQIPNSNRGKGKYESDQTSQNKPTTQQQQNSNSYRKSNPDQGVPITYEGRRDFYGSQVPHHSAYGQVSSHFSNNNNNNNPQTLGSHQSNHHSHSSTSPLVNINPSGTLRSYLNSFENVSNFYDRNQLSCVQSPAGTNSMIHPGGGGCGGQSTNSHLNPSNLSFPNHSSSSSVSSAAAAVPPQSKNLTIDTAPEQPLHLNAQPQALTGGSATVANSMLSSQLYTSNHGSIYSATNSSAPIFGNKQSTFLTNMNGGLIGAAGKLGSVASNLEQQTNFSSNNASEQQQPNTSTGVTNNQSHSGEQRNTGGNDSNGRDESPTQRRKMNNFVGGATSTSLQMPYGTGFNQNQRQFVNASINLKESSIQSGVVAPSSSNDWRSPQNLPLAPNTNNMLQQNKNAFNSEQHQKYLFPNSQYASQQPSQSQQQQTLFNNNNGSSSHNGSSSSSTTTQQTRESAIFNSGQSRTPTHASSLTLHGQGSQSSTAFNGASQTTSYNSINPPNNAATGNPTNVSSSSGCNSAFSASQNMSEVIAEEPISRGQSLEEQNQMQQEPLNPKDQQFFNNLLDQSIPLPNQEPTKCSFQRNGIVKAYAANTNQGLVRNYNEDRVSIILNIMKPSSRANEDWPKCSFFGVYDGHGGVNCADFLRDNLHQYVIREPTFPWNPKEALKNGFLSAEQQFLEIAQNQPNSAGIDRSGSCAIVVLIVGDMCYVANVGDSRAVLSGDSGLKVYTLSRDHKPTDELEQKRIISGGGQIYQTQAQTVKQNANGQPQTQILLGPMRVFPGRLSVSRTFGDIQAKLERLGGNPNVVVSEPQIKSFRITDDHDFIVIASDGIFDQLNSADVVQSVWDSSDDEKAQNVHKQCGFGVDHILRESLNQRSLDNVTVVMVAFANFKRKIFGVKNKEKEKKRPLEELNLNIPLSNQAHGATPVINQANEKPTANNFNNNNNSNNQENEPQKRRTEYTGIENAADYEKRNAGAFGTTPSNQGNQSDVRKSTTVDSRTYGLNGFVYNSVLSQNSKQKLSDRNVPNNENSLSNLVSKEKNPLTQLQQSSHLQTYNVSNTSQLNAFGNHAPTTTTTSSNYSKHRFADHKYYDFSNQTGTYGVHHNLDKR